MREGSTGHSVIALLCSILGQYSRRSLTLLLAHTTQKVLRSVMGDSRLTLSKTAGKVVPDCMEGNGECDCVIWEAAEGGIGKPMFTPPPPGPADPEEGPAIGIEVPFSICCCCCCWLLYIRFAAGPFCGKTPGCACIDVFELKA